MTEKTGEHPLSDSGQLVLLAVFLVVWAGDSFFLKKTTLSTTHLPLYVRALVGMLALGAAAYTANSGHSVVSHKHPPTGVVSTGAFRFVRHPLYLGTMLFYLALAVFTGSLAALALLAPIFIFYNHIASYEERLLEQRCGQEYTHYKRATGKWLPRIRGSR